MSSKKLETTSAKKATKAENQLLTYNFPTVGDGVTVQAASREEAEAKAQEIQKQLDNQKETKQEELSE